MPGHLELVVVHSALAVESVEERGQLEVLERLGWTAVVTQPSIPAVPLARDAQIEVFAGY